MEKLLIRRTLQLGRINDFPSNKYDNKNKNASQSLLFVVFFSLSLSLCFCFVVRFNFQKNDVKFVF